MALTILSALSRAERLSIAGTYALTLLENLCMLSYPALTGWAVDGLLKGSYRGLSALIAVWLVHLITAFGRQRFDTRVEMLRNLVAFFETDVPAMFSQVVTVVGSLLMLFTFDLRRDGSPWRCCCRWGS